MARVQRLVGRLVVRPAAGSAPAVVQRLKLNLKAKFVNSPCYLSFKCIYPGAFNLGLIGSICTALPWMVTSAAASPRV